MSSVSETGHSVNVGKFLELKTIITSLGSSYSPANPLLKPEALETLFSTCKAANDGVAVPLVNLKDKIGSRQQLMNPLSKLVTRVLRALKASGASDEAVAQASSISKKIQGIRTAKQADETEQTRTTSSSQLSISQRIGNFRTLLEFLDTIPAYAPTVEDIRLTSLQALLVNMESANLAVITAEASLAKARQTRNELLYAPVTGMVTIAQSVKDEIAAIFGFNSPVHKQVLRIKFTNRR